MKKLLLVAVALLSPICSIASDESPDAMFYRKAAAASLAEVAGGELAQQRGKRASVIGFGQLMVKDHGSANTTLKGLAIANHVELPPKPSPEDSAKLAALHNMTGDAFDKAYVEWQILSHKDAVALFNEESASGDDIDAKRFATDTLPILQAHLNQLIAMPTVVAAPVAPAAAP